MRSSKVLLLLGLAAVIVPLVSSEAAARKLAETSAGGTTYIWPGSTDSASL